jgi:hypothetical protein
MLTVEEIETKSQETEAREAAEEVEKARKRPYIAR